MSVKVANPGALSLVQDAGRTGFQRYGVSVSGAVDPEALLIGNLLVGNEPGAACIEVTFGGTELTFTDDAVIAVTGGDLSCLVDGVQAPLWESFTVPADTTLQFGAPRSGLRAYLAVAGGIDTEPVLGSRSTHTGSRLGGISGGPLEAGDELPVGTPGEGAAAGSRIPDSLLHEYSHEIEVRVVVGPQFDAFTDAGKDALFGSSYTVTENSDRQGLRLDGPEIEAVDGRYDIVSDAVVFGAIQVPGDGKPIVLLADRQTTGGYPKIGVVASVDLPLLAQAAPGSVVTFSEIAVAEAQQLLRQRREALLSADLSGSLTTTSMNLNLQGVAREISVTFDPQRLAQQDVTFVSADVDGQKVLARAYSTD